MFFVSIDIGLITFSFSIFNFNNIIPVTIGTVDISDKDIQITLKKCNKLLDFLISTYCIKLILVEHQLVGTKNIRVQYFINDYCIINQIKFKTAKAISFKQNIKTRLERKMFSQCLFETKMINLNIDIDYRDSSVFDVCDAANIGIRFIETYENVSNI